MAFPLRRLPSTLQFLFAVLIAATARAENWPQFRGPTGMGITTERDLPLTWGGDNAENVLWKVKLPGTAEGAKEDQNQSSPIVWQDRVFVMTTFWPAGRDQKEFPDQHVACYSAADGKQLWDVLVEPGPWKLSDLRGGYCAPTPATDGERVYVLFGSAVLAALDFDGRLVWRKDLPDPQAFDVAISSSPILYEGAVILLGDRNGGKALLTAYDAKTGDVRWEQKRPKVGFNHSTPTIADVGGRTEMLVAASNALQGLDPATGEILWWCDTRGDVCSPVVSHGKIYMDSGRGGPGLLVEPQGAGNITETSVKWKTGNIPEGLSSPVIAGDYLYRLHGPGVLKCFQMATGEEAFGARLDGVSASSSPILTPEGRVYLASAGKTFVLQAGPKLDLLATNDLGESSPASAAVSGGRLFLKGRQHLFCIGTRP